LYFFCFLIFVKYYLSHFNKLFKFRLTYLASLKTFTLVNTVVNVDRLTRIFVNFINILAKLNLKNSVFYEKTSSGFNNSLLKSANTAFISTYNFNCLKLSLFTKKYL